MKDLHLSMSRGNDYDSSTLLILANVYQAPGDDVKRLCPAVPAPQLSATFEPHYHLHSAE